MRVAALLLLASCAWAADTAVLRPNGKDFVIAVALKRATPAITTPLGVNLIRSNDDGDFIDRHWDVPVNQIRFFPSGAATELSFGLALPGSLYDQTASYAISIPLIPSSAGAATRAEIALTPGLDGEILADPSTVTGFCPGGVMIALRGPRISEADWKAIDNFFAARETDPNTDLRFRAGSGDAYAGMPIRTLVRQTRSLAGVIRGVKYSVCVNTVHQLPRGAFNGIVDFGTGAPTLLKLISPVTASDLDGRQTPSMKDANSPPGNVGERALERNLDLGLAYTQSRDQKTDQINRVGVLDLRLAPLLDIRRRMGQQFLSRQTVPSCYWFLTPVYIDANVATGPIADSTVSLNRIAMGPQLEFRYMKLRSSTGDPTSSTGLVPLPRYPDVHRFILSATHYSDRDFKQLEYVAKFEYEPLLGIWNRPRDTRWKSVKDPVKKTVIALEPVGWKIEPKFGAEIGNTYERRNPADAIKTSDFVRRGYAGLDIALELTDYFSFSVSDTAYLRGEIAPGHLVNYIKLEANFPVGSPFRETAQSFFVTYERGSLPPFDKLNANALRLGYRIRSENWFGYRR